MPAIATEGIASMKIVADLEAYRRMLRIRRFEEEGTRLFKEGVIPGAYHSSIGHEAAIVGACIALQADDFMTGTHRSHGHPIGKGADLRGLMAELMGKETGICKGRGGSMHLADSSVGIVSESAIVGGGIPLATGCGLSAKVRKTSQVSLCFFGDGAVNQGTFHESLNMASLWKLPVIYLCENNGYAISTSLAQSHGQIDIAKRADAYGMPGVTVDGQDIEAVYGAAHQAVSRARSGGGPTLVVAQTYRFDEHNVGLNVAVPYRPREEVERFIAQKDPIQLYRQKLLAYNRSETEISSVENSVRSDVLQAIEFGEASQLPAASTLYQHLYSTAIGTSGGSMK
jgi:TPP-dependent pyruvate/acetoin dehydrogenase alpha subunit